MRFMLQESTMNNDLLLAARSLGKGRIRHLAAQAGRSVECLSGSIWITQDGDRRDIVLGPGEAFAFDRRTDALLSAFDDSRYLVLDAGEAISH
jgi:ferric-dicitrate binding protein FerR (iron transport regulator)